MRKIVEQRLQEKMERRAAREARRMEDERRAAEAAEAKARADPWTQEQQDRFEKALLEFTLAYEKEERWRQVAAAVGDKNRNQCMARYKFIKDLLRQQKLIAEAE